MALAAECILIQHQELLIMSLALRFLGLLFASVLLPVAALDYFLKTDFAGASHNVVVLLIMACAIASFVSILRFDKFPGSSSVVLILPVIAAWYVVPALITLLPSYANYAIYFFVCFVLCFVYVYIDYNYHEKNRRPVLAYLPMARASDLSDIKTADWVVMTDPKLPERAVEGVVVDLHAPTLSAEWQKFLAQCALEHMPVYNVRQIRESLTGRVRIQHMYENDLGSLLPSAPYMFIKRLWETSLVLFSMPAVLPVMALTAVAIKMESPGPILFLQKRVGQSGKEFTIYKFRSMCRDSEKDGAQFAQVGDMRVTKVGKFIRKTRIDELPQFFNIIKGDMSLIGPRPEQKVFVDRFEGVIPFYSYRHVVKPGISGWAQVVHGYAADADETQVKVEYDFYYIKHFSFWLDILIVFKTIRTMITGFGAR